MKRVVRVATPIGRRKLFDYLWTDNARPPVGYRVLVPFGKQQRIGLIVESTTDSDLPLKKLREVSKVLDDQPVISESLMKTLVWLARYCHQPLPEVLWSALPTPLRKGRPLVPKLEMGFMVTPQGRQVDPRELKRAAVQRRILETLQAHRGLVAGDALKDAGTSWQAAVKRLEEYGWVLRQELDRPQHRQPPDLIQDLNFEQLTARNRIIESLDQYESFLLHGVTGSGKTEVYLHVIAEVIGKGQQALLLVPEIGLTPQLIDRVERALGMRVVSYHSNMTPHQRHRSWHFAKSGTTQVVVGTRSAVFLPFKNLGLIVMDEEHDASYKQQEGVRYHARSAALHRAATNKIPFILGSATPSLETINAASEKRVTNLVLTRRATRVQLPAVHLVDLNNAYVLDGIAVPLLKAIEKRLKNNEQSLIFVNRRGFSPVIWCSNCRWIARCADCDVKLTYHVTTDRLHCHLCGKSGGSRPGICPQCDSVHVELLGEGTQKVEQFLKSRFPGTRVLRIDSDVSKGYRKIQSDFERIQRGEVDILVGTQMLSKGHHFPGVTLVGVLGADRGFFSIDFRAREYLVQQVLQVAGRAGREGKPGQVLIQTAFHDNELFATIVQHNYLLFARQELEQRREALQPPFSSFALLRANSTKSEVPKKFLNTARAHAIEILRKEHCPDVRVLDVVSSPIERIAKRHRAQLLTSAASAVELRKFLRLWVQVLETIPKRQNLRWNLDVDPIDFY